MIQLPTSFKEFLKLSNEAGVEYLLIGGYAVGIHGYVHFTDDLDIWLRFSPVNLFRLEQVLTDFGFSKEELQKVVEVHAGQKIRVGVPPLRIDIVTAISSVSFDQAYPRGMTVDVDGVQVHVIGFADLKVNKSATGRLHDLVHVEGLGP